MHCPAQRLCQLSYCPLHLSPLAHHRQLEQIRRRHDIDVLGSRELVSTKRPVQDLQPALSAHKSFHTPDALCGQLCEAGSQKIFAYRSRVSSSLRTGWPFCLRGCAVRTIISLCAGVAMLVLRLQQGRASVKSDGLDLIMMVGGLIALFEVQLGVEAEDEVRIDAIASLGTNLRRRIVESIQMVYQDV